MAAVYVAVLRAINLAGHRAVAMADLRNIVTRLGFANARTLLQSGNVIFEGKGRPADLEALLERELAKMLRLETDVFVRTAGELQAVVAQNPFPDAARSDPARLVVMFLKQAPPTNAVESLRAAIVGREVVEAVGRHAYIVYPDGIGRSKLTHASIERRLETRGTGRNWSTVLKLAALAGM